MTRTLVTVTLALVLGIAVSSRAVADVPSPAPVPVATVAAPSYDDAGMHFEAPVDFHKLDIPKPPDAAGQDDDSPTPVAAFVYHAGRTDQRAITILVSPFDGPVDQFDTSHVSDERKGEDTFVAENKKTTLANGMPAYFIKASSGSTAGQFRDRFEYLVCDGTRSIVVQYSGPAGIDEAAAKNALATLYVVVYPKHRA
jgi:hypothetical protein